MNFLPESIEHYVSQFTSEEPKILQNLNRETQQKILMPRMIAGHYQGRWLSMMSHMIKPNRVLEIGTYTGYSALCWAEGLLPEGKVYTIDINEELESMVGNYIKQAGLESKIIHIIGQALDIIPSINETWDIVFIDADKENYSAYYDLIFDHVRPGGYIIADNVLWSGKVVNDKALEKDKNTLALHQFNQKVKNDVRVEHVLLGIRDGIMIVRKRLYL